MKMKLKKTLAILIALVSVIALLSTSAFAYTPYTSYNYDFYGDIVAGPEGYVPERILFGSDCGIDEFINPSDMFIAHDNSIYVVDSGASGGRTRVIILTPDFKVKKIISNFIDPTGKQLDVINGSGICVDKDNNIYLCNPDAFRILKMNTEGKVSLVYGAPPSEFVTSSFLYRPEKVGLAINGSIYVISKGCTDGILEFDTKGAFVRFFGAPEVELSVSDYFNIYWRNIYRVFGGDSVDDYFATYVPSEFSNLTVDKNGFVFTMVASNESSIDEVYKLNFIGANILDPTEKSATKKTASMSRNYGDLITRTTMGKGNVFADVCLDNDGFFSLLDTNLGRVFEYDKEGNLIFVYGGKGNETNQIQYGLLDSACAICKLGKKTVVIDSSTGAITIFKLSDYGEQLHNAVNLYNDGKYETAEKPWNTVLKYDANSELAHIGLGKVHYLQGDYKEALSEFKLGNDRNNYSRSFKLYRDEVIRSNFPLVVTLLIVLIVLLIVIKKYGKKIKGLLSKNKEGDR